MNRTKSWWGRQVLIFLAIFQLVPLLLVAFIPPDIGIPICFAMALAVTAINYVRAGRRS